MIAKIQETLSRLHLDIWRINWSRTRSAELFFIRRGADMSRAIDVTQAHVTVFRDFEADGAKMRGMSQISVYPGMTDADMESALQEAYESARHVKNPWFALPEAVQDLRAPEQPTDLNAAAREMADALFSADVLAKAFVNSAEIFAVEEQVRVLASNGLDVGYTSHSYKGEFVVQCQEGQDVELYRSFAYRTPDRQALKKEAEEALHTVQDRAGATGTPRAGSYDCVLSGRQLENLLSCYASKADASMIYAKYSQYAVGAGVQGENVSGEKLNIALTSDAPYSPEGVPMPGMELVRDGVLQALHGAARFCRYLDMEPRGSYHAVQVANGSVPMAEICKAPCIHPVVFSDFQMDPFSGRFGGEIRLAYVYDESGMHCVTGGSINGSLLELQGDMVFSTERYTTANYEGPLAVRLKNVSVAGQE